VLEVNDPLVPNGFKFVSLDCVFEKKVDVEED
jgi:hypothetical protein